MSINPLGQIFACSEEHLRALIDGPEITAEAIARAKAQAIQMEIPDEDLPLQIVENVAVLTVSGVMTKTRSWFSFLFGGGFSMAEYQQAVRLAEDRVDVDTLITRWSTPGGTVDGLEEFAATLRDAGKSLRTVSYVDGMMASGGLWVGSQSAEIITSRTALTGSLGVIFFLDDREEEFRRQGRTIIPIRSGSLKFAGRDGEPISEEIQASMQRMVNSTADVFYAEVAAGRGVTAEAVAERWGSGDIWVGQQAVDVGLADRVDSFQNVLDSMIGSRSPTQARSLGPQPLRASASGLTEESENMDAKSKTDANPEDEGLLAQIKTLLRGAKKVEAAPVAASPAPATASKDTGADDRLAALEARSTASESLLATATKQLAEAVSTIGALNEKLEKQASTSRVGSAVAQVNALVTSGVVTPARAALAEEFLNKHGEILTDDELSAHVAHVEAEGKITGPAITAQSDFTMDQEDGSTVIVNVGAHSAGGTVTTSNESLELHARILSELGESDGTAEYAQKYQKAAFRLEGSSPGDRVLKGVQ